MAGRTRYFVIVSLLVLGVGLGTGLLAYYVGLPQALTAGRTGPDELRYVPRDAAVLAYANVRDVMTSDLRRRVNAAMPARENGQREFQDRTGIDIENDVDRVVACLDPAGDTPSDQVGMVLARGRFDEVKIESLLRDHGARVEDYKGKRLILAEHDGAPPRHGTFAMTFLEPGLAAFGSDSLVRSAVDLQRGGANVTSNSAMMDQVKAVDDANAWAIGRFDALRTRAKLPANIAGQIPAITWFSVSGHVDGGLRGVLRAQTRDEESANNLRDVVRGFLALAKMQAGERPALKPMMDSLQLGGNGTTVALSFDVPADAFGLINQLPRP